MYFNLGDQLRLVTYYRVLYYSSFVLHNTLYNQLVVNACFKKENKSDK